MLTPLNPTLSKNLRNHMKGVLSYLSRIKKDIVSAFRAVQFILILFVISLSSSKRDQKCSD